MNVYDATKLRIRELCSEHKITVCRLATISGIPHTTLKSILYGQSKDPQISTIKKICDGLNITIAEFFDTEIFNNLEQEIK